MMHEGALSIEWIKSPQQSRGDVYRVTFATYQNPDHTLFTREVKTEMELKAFCGEEINCKEETVLDTLKELSRHPLTRINHIQLADEAFDKLGRREN